MRLLLVLAVLTGAHAHGAGVWKDPNHYVGDHSLAGLRFVSESPPHTLRLVGTDDGTTWFALRGTCSGRGMTVIKFDFSRKGGPKELAGTWASVGATQNITWPDGNKWTLLKAPTPAFRSDPLDDHAGVFFDPNHHVPGTWKGLRLIAEDPPHSLKMVGSDDGVLTGMWFLEGRCTGVHMTSIHFDFSPKGGPADLVGVWAAAPARTITWPDGNAWSKAPPALDHPRDDPRGQAVYAESLSASAARSGGSGSAGAGVFLALAGLLAAFAYVRRHSLRRAFEGRPMPRLWKPEHDRIRDYDVEPGA